MAGDPSRRPSNERIKMPGVDTLIWVQCQSCFGDGWFRIEAWHRCKDRCTACNGRGKVQILALHRRPGDVAVDPPRY